MASYTYFNGVVKWHQALIVCMRWLMWCTNKTSRKISAVSYPATEQLIHHNVTESSVTSASTSAVENKPEDKHVCCCCWCCCCRCTILELSLLSSCLPPSFPPLPPWSYSRLLMHNSTGWQGKCAKGHRKGEREGEWEEKVAGSEGEEREKLMCVCARVCDSMSVVLGLSRASVSSPEERSCWFNWSQPRPCRPCPHPSLSLF